MFMKKIHSIDFRVLDPKTIRKMSAIEIKTPDTYDKDGYPMDGGLMDPHLGVINPGLRCKTCGQKMKDCPGHFGSIEFVRPVLHPEFSKKLELIMQSTCQECGRLNLPDDKLKMYESKLEKGDLEVPTKIVRKAKTAKECEHCKAPKEKILLDKPTNFFLGKERIYPTEIREWIEKIPEMDLKLLGYDLEITKPEWFITSVLPVPPITVRPSITLESGVKSEDDLTHKLVDIIRVNLRLNDNIDAGAPQLIIEDLWDLLQYHVTTYYNNNTAGVPPAKHRSGRALRTLVQRLKGKKGRFRHNLTGKRVNFAARSTVSPDSFISINEIGIPQDIANDLTLPEPITEATIDAIKKKIKETDEIQYVARPNGQRRKITDETRDLILEEIEPGFKIERSLQNGDIVLFNRQPSLHRLSMMAHKVRIMDGKTLRINPVVCKPYNADFDGDEMNIHVPQTEEGKSEAQELMYVQNNVISPRYGAPVVVLEEDGVSGVYILTLDSTEFSKDEAMKYFYEMGIKELPKPDKGKNYSGKLIFSQMLPDDLNLEYTSNTCKVLKKTGVCTSACKGDKCPYGAYVKIKDGVLETGVIDSSSLGEAKGILIDTLARQYSSDVIEKFYNMVNRVVSDLLTKKGMTAGLDEYEMSDKIKKASESSIENALKEGTKLVKKYENKTLDIIPGKTLQESFEIGMMRLSAETKEEIEKMIMSEKVQKVLGKNPELNTTVMILSGSRGSSTNLMNIAGFWGQASVREGRPKRGFKNRLITLNEKDDVGLITGGFINQNFMDGMKGKEYFYHSMGGRQGEVDTGVSTKVSGYLYRRLANSLKDLFVETDRTVRTASKNLVQYSYGEDGIFPMKSIKGKSMNVKKSIEKDL